MATPLIRPYADADESAVLGLLGASLQKEVDERYRQFFRWKHLENPFGRSFMWVAETGSAIVGFRSFLKWSFRLDGGIVPAVRAVDTATDPAHRGTGIFRRLTLHGLDEIAEAGVAFVFNTPNDQSRPGYLRMGWEVVGRVPVQVVPRWRVRSVRAMSRARTPASTWSSQAIGDDPSSVISAVTEGAASRHGVATAWDPASLSWRVSGFSPASYSAMVDEAGPTLFRNRRRGSATECTIGWHGGHASSIAALVRAAGADYAIGASRGGRWRGAVPARRLGPILTYRTVDGTEMPPLDRWALDLLDLELM